MTEAQTLFGIDIGILADYIIIACALSFLIEGIYAAIWLIFYEIKHKIKWRKFDKIIKKIKKGN